MGTRARSRYPWRATAAAATLISLLAAAGPASAAPKPLSLQRPDDPVVLQGSQLGALAGIVPDRLVAYRHVAAKKPKKSKRKGRKRGAGKGRWVRVPVQVDERATVPFGTNTAANSTPGADGTVYGTPAGTLSALQYTDPGTFVGADPDASLDADDEVALMAGDAGTKAPKAPKRPKGTTGAGSTVALSDPLGSGRAYLYLFRAAPGADASAPKDYVDYDFKLTSGGYRATYKRGDGPNPETSLATTANYRVGFSDRWFFDTLRVAAGSAGGADILDGHKFAFGRTNCGRSESTFHDAEGAFVANIDGPVRAIRSYVGANSGPFTERTHILYRSRQQIVTDLRVHPLGGAGFLSYYAMSPAAHGMTYRDSTHRGGVSVDGAPDAVGNEAASWHLWSGPQGSLFTTDAIESSFQAAFDGGLAENVYEDGGPSQPFTQCSGDPSFHGAAGTFLDPVGDIPNTDPTLGAAAQLRATSVDVLAAPGAGAADADRWSAQLATPLAVSASPRG